MSYVFVGYIYQTIGMLFNWKVRFGIQSSDYFFLEPPDAVQIQPVR